MNDVLVPKKGLAGRFGGKSPVGNPRGRCEDDVGFLQIRTGRRYQWRWKAGGRRSGRPWPEKGPNCHRRTERRRIRIIPHFLRRPFQLTMEIGPVYKRLIIRMFHIDSDNRKSTIWGPQS
jgi:hypothetical protein